MFYAIAKRRRDLNAAEDKGHEKGVVEGLERGLVAGHERGLAEGLEKGLAEGEERGRVATLDALVARLSEPGADPMAVITELRNGTGQ